MKHTVIVSLICAIIASFSSHATEQLPDRLIINGDTLLLHALPLEQWKEQNNWERPLFPDSLFIFSTGCWRGYIAYWEVIDNRLYLTNIYNGDLSAQVSLDTLFVDKVCDGRVYADWFSDTVTAYRGKLLYYLHMGFSSIFEDEFEYVFDKGVLISSAYFDNSLSKNVPLIMNELDLTPIIDSLINWAALPPIEENIRVMLHVEADKLGQVDSVLEISGHSDIFNQEALRVAHLLTQLPVIYKRGELLRESRFLIFVFTKKKQQQFLLKLTGLSHYHISLARHIF